MLGIFSNTGLMRSMAVSLVAQKGFEHMLMGVILFNPLIALVVLHSFPLEHITLAKDFILSDVAYHLGGTIFQYMMVFNAFFVLCGAVLTSFVGVSGLMYRMTLDNCLPARVLLPKLKHRNQNVTRIIIAFSLLCVAILGLTKGNLLSLTASIYLRGFLITAS
jgi:amino acid transporter